MFPWHLDALFSLKYSTLKCFASFLKIGSYVSLLRLEHVHSVFYGHKSFIRYVVCKYCFLACGLSFCLLKYLSKRRFLTLIKSCLQFFSTVVQSLSHVGLLQPHGLQHTRLPCPSTISQSLLKLMSIELMMPSNNLILCHPLLLPSIFPSVRVFSNESVLCIRWPKFWNFSFSINPSSEYSGLISFRIDWFDFLAVQGTLNSFLLHYS